MMGTSDVRIDVKLNKAVWAKGIKSVPYRIRVPRTQAQRRWRLRRSSTPSLLTFQSSHSRAPKHRMWKIRYLPRCQ